ncbi:MAG: hypothetical protein BGO26_08760 [Actinobacteria bacterium 69-20]|nr:MAG: hypothetical protein BGO26_08760 [Actinobacteria bacterium 69-20]
MADGTHGTATAHEKVSVITEARPSYQDEFRSRRRRYVIMMGLRVPCLIAAAALYHTPWLAVLIILISIPLPWMAVLIANDGPARKPIRAPRGALNNQRALPGPARPVIEAVPDDGTQSGNAGPSADGAYFSGHDR